MTDDDLGLPVDRSKLLAAQAEAHRLARTILRLAASPDLTVHSIATVLAESVCELTGARLVAVAVPELLSEAVVAGPDATWISVAHSLERVPLVAVALEGSFVQISDTSTLGPAAGQANELATLDGRPYRSLAAVPIGGAERTTGAVLIAHHRARAFSERQLALARALAEHLGRSIEMVEAVQSQRRIADALQESLLPPLLPTIPGIELAARYRPSGSGNLVGGDFYDAFSDGAGSWYVLLGDASGIGPEAAGLAGIARYTARALGDTAPQPKEMLAQINRALLRAAAEGRFCTALLARLSPGRDGAAADVELASAGHPPAYLLRRGGEVIAAAQETGLILGIAEDAPVGRADIRLAPGDAVVMYTDGVIEARNESGEPFGDLRLAETLAGAKGRSAEGIARRLERAVLDHRSQSARDDVAIVVVRVSAAASS